MLSRKVIADKKRWTQRIYALDAKGNKISCDSDGDVIDITDHYDVYRRARDILQKYMSAPIYHYFYTYTHTHAEVLAAWKESKYTH